jgi:two-component system response regulator YesN
MYKVLLVDDEILDLEGMRTFIPWEELDMEVVDAVNNGFAAYGVIENEHIDILVTDVRMPNMTGFELFKKALEKQEYLRVIFISGYQDFEYVKQALSLNAGSYVLKPTDDQELKDSLIKVKNELDLQKKRSITEQAFKEMVPIVKNEYLLKLLEGKFDSSTIDVLNQEYGMNSMVWPARVAVLESDDLSWNLNPYSDHEKHEFISGFYESVLAMCQERQIQHVCKVTQQRLALLLDSSMGLTVLHDLTAKMKIEFPFTVTVGLGGDASSMTTVQKSFRQGGEALEYKMFQGKGILIDFTEVKPVEMEDVKKLDIQLDSLLHAMSNYMLVQIYDEIESLFNVVYKLNSKFTIHNFAMYIIMKLDGYLHTMNEDLFQLLNLELKNLDILFQFETIDDIRSWLRKRVYELSETLHLKKQNKNYRLVHEIIEYVNERLHENISLRDVANQFSFSPNYLGYLFKEETDQNFTDYVIMCRMDRAREMLIESKLKIYEIADQVGYRYLPYFSRQFKETYGMTPMEYRRRG